MQRKKKVGLVSALGTGFEIIKSLVQEVEKCGGDENDVRQLLNPDLGLLQEVAKFIAGTTEIVWEGTVEIDRSRTYEQRVESYGITFSGIPEYHPIKPGQGKDKVTLALVKFGKVLEVPAAEECLEKLCLKHSTAEEAIGFGDQYRHVIYKFGKTMSFGDAKSSEQKSSVSDETIPFHGKIGNKAYFEVLSLSWPNPGCLTLSTHQFFSRTWPGCCILCREKD